MTWCPGGGSWAQGIHGNHEGHPDVPCISLSCFSLDRLFEINCVSLVSLFLLFCCPVAAGQAQKDEDVDVTVSSSVDCSGTLNFSDVASSVTPNPFISAFKNLSTAGGPSPQQTHTILSLSNRHLNRRVKLCVMQWISKYNRTNILLQLYCKILFFALNLCITEVKYVTKMKIPMGKTFSKYQLSCKIWIYSQF